MEMSKRFLLVIWMLAVSFYSGCVNPYSYYSNPYAFQASGSTSGNVPQETIYLTPAISKDKVTPVKRFIIKIVEQDLPAYKSGIKIGDEILSINGRSFNTYETFLNYLRKARHLEKDFRLIRNEKGAIQEKTIKVKPEKGSIGIWVKFIGADDRPVFPIIASEDNPLFQYQAREKYGFGAVLAIQGSVLVAACRLHNFTDADVVVDLQDAVLIDKNKTSFSPMARKEAIAQQYTDELSKNVFAGMKGFSMMAALNSAETDSNIKILPNTNRIEYIYWKKEYVSFSVKIQVEIQDEKFVLEFDRSV